MTWIDDLIDKYPVMTFPFVVLAVVFILAVIAPLTLIRAWLDDRRSRRGEELSR